MRCLLIILLTISLLSCNTHTYFTREDLDNSDNTIARTIDTKTFDHYYKVVYHRGVERARAFYTPRWDTTDLHITDIQHLLINEATREFILISYIPVAKRSNRKDSYYMDCYLKDFKDSINVYYINNLVWGPIVNNHLVLAYENGYENKYLGLYKTREGNIKIEAIKYPARQSKGWLGKVSDVFPDSAFLFMPMRSHGMKFHGPPAKCEKIEKHYEIKESITFSKIIQKRRLRKPEYPQGEGKKNMIIFEYAETGKNKNGESIGHVIFLKKADRFSFLYPPK